MGSSGSGSFSDYPGSSRGGSGGSSTGGGSGGGDSGGGGSGGGGSGGGGNGGGDPCDRAFNTELEDVQQSDYWNTNGGVPPIGTEVEIVRRKRLVAQDAAGLSIGNLPTALNSLAACLEKGWTYVGTVQAASSGPPEPSIVIDVAAVAP